MEDTELDREEFFIWLNNGIDRGWISNPYCNTHDGGYEYLSEDDIKQLEEGGDPCDFVMKLFVN